MPSSAPPEPPPALAAATEHQPRARAALGAALRAPSHAYLLRGPRGSGKRPAARAFAAELLAETAADPEGARRQALAEPPVHPDLAVLAPAGAWHLVDDVRESVIRAASLRPVDGERRVFLIEEAEAMRDESQNALLKTLEEPAPFAHLILVCSEPEALLATIASRCQEVAFGPLPAEAIAASLDATGADAEVASRLAAGDLELARLLASERGRELRRRAERAARAARSGGAPSAARETQDPWQPLLEIASEAGAEAGAEAEERLRSRVVGRGGRLPRDAVDQVRRIERRARTEVLDAGLALCGAWYRDLGTVGEGAPELALHGDRLEELEADAAGLDPARAREAVELVLDTRRRLRLNVAEELAMAALWSRLAAVIAP